ncbi:MAG: Glu/Leu/Phe/Val dehydrogenase family protein [Eubacteriaceae bacterium]|jgi:leucine dehydrogenase|nr:Glu/Leu/Phe/Val dehydrogenase family protein [Eubacteriaceae bacterium]
MDKRSLFYPLEQEGLTTLRIQYDWKTGNVYLAASKDWDDDLDWSRYNKDFYVESIKTHSAKYLNEQEVKDMFEKYGLTDYLEEVLELIREGRHFGILGYYNKALDIRYMGNMHSRKCGINNGRHATMGGGIRRHEKSEDELDVIIDGLNLGRAMSFKNIAGELPMGGIKSTVMMDPLDLDNFQQIGFLAFALDSMRCETGPDMGFPIKMTDVMIDNEYSYQYTCGPQGPLGSSGPPTAYGVYIALEEAIKFLGHDNMDGWSFACQGLGEVGWAMVKEICTKVKNPHLIVADVKQDVVDRCVKEWSAQGIDIKAGKIEDILFEDVDVVVPCAIGGIFTEENIEQLRCKIIWGSANNQIKASSQEEEIRLAQKIADRGILFQTDWWHNTAGVMFAWEEVCYQKQADINHVYKVISDVLPRLTRDNLKESKELGLTPTANAYRRVEEILYGDAPAPERTAWLK